MRDCATGNIVGAASLRIDRYLFIIDAAAAQALIAVLRLAIVSTHAPARRAHAAQAQMPPRYRQQTVSRRLSL